MDRFPKLMVALPLILIAIAVLFWGIRERASKSVLSPESRSPSPHQQAKQTGKARRIRYLQWEDYTSPEAIAAFTKETGIEVEQKTFLSYDECRAYLESSPGSYDVVIAEAAVVAEWVGLALIQSLDHSKLPLFSNLDPRFLNLATDPGNRYSVPFQTGTTVIAYRSAKVTPNEKSWNLFWDPVVKGKAKLLDDPREVFAIGFLHNGLSVNSSDADAFDLAVKDLSRMVAENEVGFGTSWNILDELSAGDIWVAHAFSGDAAMYVAKNPHIAIAVPREGASQWLDHFVIARDSKNVDEAHTFINFMLRPQSAAKTVMHSHYATPNRAALPLLSHEILSDPNVFPPKEMLDRCEVLKPLDVQRMRQLQLGMRTLHSASRQDSSRDGGRVMAAADTATK
jgi:spermidine/putrescine transport system substrate-binding protein